MKDAIKKSTEVIEETKRLIKKLAEQISLTRKFLERDPEYKAFRDKLRSEKEMDSPGS